MEAIMAATDTPSNNSSQLYSTVPTAFTQYTNPALLAIVGISLYAGYLLLGRSSSKKLPPGPRGWPIIGNLFDMPKEGTYGFRHWLNMREIYGPIISLNVVGTTFIIIQDKGASNFILEKKSALTSDRMPLDFMEYCGFAEFMLNTQFKDERLKDQRKAMHAIIGSRLQCLKFAPVQEKESKRMLVRLLEEPQSYSKHAWNLASAIILKTVYDYTIDPYQKDFLIQEIEEALEYFEYTAKPLQTMFDIYPWPRSIPSWFPGAGYHKKAVQIRNHLMRTIDRPFQFIQRQLERGEGKDAYVSLLVEKYSGAFDAAALNKKQSEAAKWTAGIMYIAGSDTTSITLNGFLLAMVKYPEAQRKAQAEIDALTGGTRFPTVAEVNELPYLNALLTEVLRWAVAVPLSFPHVAAEELTYEGYTIPKGAVLMNSTWWHLRNPDTYTNPDHFEPNRYLEPRNEADPRAWVYGSGRRACPGRHMAESNILVALAHVLAFFNINRDVDANGKEIDPEVQYLKDGINLHFKPFEYKIEVRSEKHREMVAEWGRQNPWEDGSKL